MFKHILVPTDGSQLSQDTAKKAVALAKETGARITAFYAKHEASEIYWDKISWATLPEQAKLEEATERDAQKILSFIEDLSRNAGVSCAKVSTTCDSVYKGIINAATTGNCDLIFMASHGLRGIDALLLGSETNKVLTHSKIPVLVYR